ncbi:MAG: C4-type zinc ribbon domain-containing protein [Anaerolineaceae bacterium]
MSRSSDLYRLQKIDSQRDQAQARLNEIERILQQDEAIQTAEKALSKAQADHNAAQEDLRSAENASQTQRIKIQQDESSLYGSKSRSPKELTDLQNEIASLKKFLITLEDRQLSAMMLEEETRNQHAKAQVDMDVARANANSRFEAFTQERAQIHQNLERLETERGATLRLIPAADLGLYQQLRSTRRGLAVAQASDQSCGACGASLPPADWQAARSGTQIKLCPSCGRILYAG